MSSRQRPHHLHLMADYGSAGVWDHDGNPLDPPDCRSAKTPRPPGTLAARFEKSFETEIDLEAFAAEGRAIARAVKAELPELVDRLLRRGRRRPRQISGHALDLRHRNPMTDQLPAVFLNTALATTADTYIVPALIANEGERPAGATSSSSPPTSTTRTHAAPMPEPARGSSPGVKHGG